MRDDRGFTLVEQLVGIVLGLLVLFAALNAFDGFMHIGSSNTNLTQAEDATRQRLDETTRLLRNAQNAAQTNPILAPAGAGGANDLTFTTADGTGAITSVRLCVDTAARTLWQETLASAVTTAPSTACGTSTTWRRAKLATNAANTAATPLFQLDSARREVDINLLLDGSSRAKPLSLRSSALIRVPGTPTAPTQTTTTTTTTTPVATVTEGACQLVAGVYYRTLSALNVAGDVTFSQKLANGVSVALGIGQSVQVAAPAGTPLAVATSVPGYSTVSVHACP